MTSLTTRLAESVRALAGSFGNPGLRRLQLAFVGSEIGGWGYTIALMVLVFDEGGAAALGVLTLVIMLAPGIAAPFTGILGDRFDRIRVMVAADLVRVVLMAAAAAVAFAGAPSEILYALAALSSVAGTAFRPAQAAVLPSLARTPEELTAANVASSTIESAGAFAGPALAGVIVALTDPGVSFALAAGTFLWSAALLNGIRTHDRVEDQTEHTEPESIPEVVTAGARAVVTDPGARTIVSLVSAQTFVSGTLLVFLPVLALDLLDWGEEGFGAVNAALGIGGIVGAVAAVTLVGVRRLSRPLAIGTLLWGAPIALAAAWDTKAGALVLFGIVGLANTIVDVSAYTMLQRAVPDRVLARVFGVLESLIYATHAIGGVVAAVLVEAFGLRAALVAVGAFLPVIVVLTWPRLRRLDASVDAPERALELLRGVPFLAVLPAPALEALAERAVPVTVAAGEAVFQQAEPGDRFYVIGDGTAGVTADGEVRPSLGRGEFFGEIALLRDMPRTATVTARTDLDLLAVERDDFIAAVTGHAPSADAAGAVVGTRLAAKGPALAAA